MKPIPNGNGNNDVDDSDNNNLKTNGHMINTNGHYDNLLAYSIAKTNGNVIHQQTEQQQQSQDSENATAANGF